MYHYAPAIRRLFFLKHAQSNKTNKQYDATPNVSLSPRNLQSVVFLQHDAENISQLHLSQKENSCGEKTNEILAGNRYITSRDNLLWNQMTS